MKKFATLLVSSLVLAFSGVSAQPAKKPVTLKLGHIQSEVDLWHVGAKKFADLVEQKTQGGVIVKLYPNSTIGNDRDMAEVADQRVACGRGIHRAASAIARSASAMASIWSAVPMVMRRAWGRP